MLRRVYQGAMAIIVALSPVTLPQQAQAADVVDEPGARFTLGVLPDTQFYSRYATDGAGNPFKARYGSEPFNSQTSWWAGHAQELNTSLVMHLGDIVDRVKQQPEWDVADRAMQKLEDAKVSYSILAGNHDVDAEYATYQARFSKERASRNPTFVERDPDDIHEAHVFKVGEQPFLVINLSWGANATAIAWAQKVLDAHPGVPTILNSHQLINVDTDGRTAIPTDFGERIWNSLIRKNDQIFLTFNGHHHGVARWERRNDAGHLVHQILMDHQMAYMGGNGLMGMVEFDLTHNKISQTTFSAWVTEKLATTLTPYDVALIACENATFDLDFDFRARFPKLQIGAADKPSATKQLRTSMGSFKAPAAPELQRPTSTEDYPHVAGTKAHWRPSGLSEAPVPFGGVVSDATGQNPLRRVDPKGFGATGEPGDATTIRDTMPYSSSPGGLCFANSKRTGNRANWFATDAPLNKETFPNGYTFETFIKIDARWTEAENRWMAWLSRGGDRAIAGAKEDPGEPPMSWGFSNLREIQFALMDFKGAENSAWSGEIVNFDQWMHIAAINDPASNDVTIYVNGIPALRTAPGARGITSINDLLWNLGAGMFNRKHQAGFLGCIGETRIVDHALKPTQWLTARAETTVPTATPPATTMLPSPSAVPKGTPGDVVVQPGVREGGGVGAVPSAPSAGAKGDHDNVRVSHAGKVARTGGEAGGVLALALLAITAGIYVVRRAR